jgi:hypothetical protein
VTDLANAVIAALREGFTGGHTYRRGPPLPRPHNPGSSGLTVLGAGQPGTTHGGEERLVVWVHTAGEPSWRYTLTATQWRSMVVTLASEGYVCDSCARNWGRLYTAHRGCVLGRIISGKGNVVTDDGGVNYMRGYDERHWRAALRLGEMVGAPGEGAERRCGQ